VATYYNATAEWILQGLAGNPYTLQPTVIVNYLLRVLDMLSGRSLRLIECRHVSWILVYPTFHS
jgi:hypothetical protein